MHLMISFAYFFVVFSMPTELYNYWANQTIVQIVPPTATTITATAAISTTTAATVTPTPAVVALGAESEEEEEVERKIKEQR